jgi:hypothetical protein
MQNKPNLKNDQMNANPYLESRYKKFTRQGLVADKPNQTQFKPNPNPKQSHFLYQKPPSKPKQTQFERNKPKLYSPSTHKFVSKF